MSAVLSAHRLNKRFGAVIAADDLSLDRYQDARLSIQEFGIVT